MGKIFIGWSGKFSNEIAKILQNWIQEVLIQIERPFVSQDIEKGRPWLEELNKELAKCHFGILCITEKNLESSWLHFEAGALLKQLGESNVCPFLYKVEYFRLKGPLKELQATKFEKEDVFRLIQLINKSCMEKEVPPNQLRHQYDLCWPGLIDKLRKLEDSCPSNIKRNVSMDNNRKILSLLNTQKNTLKEINSKMDKLDFDYHNSLNGSGVSRSSIFGSRRDHFLTEKKAIARKTIDIIQKELIDNETMKFCLLIDSGTTTYELFCEISDRIAKVRTNKKNKDRNKILDIWSNRVFIITNNLPGIQYLITNCRTGSTEYSDLFVKCLFLPGKPLPVYAAVAGSDTINFLTKFDISKRIENELGVEKRDDYQIISIISGNYIVRHHDDDSGKELFCPVARGGEVGGHYAIKKEFVNMSNKIYLISPLTKFSFATCDCLNKISGYYINAEKFQDDARKLPDKVMYSEVELITPEYIEKCSFVFSDRKRLDHFHNFSRELRNEIKNSYGASKINVAEYDVEGAVFVGKDSPNYRDLEIEVEIPHQNLRNAYLQYLKENDDQYIWSRNWKHKQEY